MIFLSGMKETVFQYQFLKRKHQRLHIIFHNELGKIKILLHKNMYPKIVVDNQTKSFLEKQFT